MSDEVSEREKLVEAIMRRPQQPTIADAVSVIKLETLQGVQRLLELDNQLRVMYWNKRSTVDW